MLSDLIGMVIVAALAFGAYLFGGKKQRTKAENESENLSKATKGRIEDAINNAGDNWRGELHKRK